MQKESGVSKAKSEESKEKKEGMTEAEKQMKEGEILKNGRTEKCKEKKEIGEGSQKKEAKNGRNKVSKEWK